eukprot:jgi/Botrbrau1/20296/Bobra.31_1s0074.1
MELLSGLRLFPLRLRGMGSSGGAAWMVGMGLRGLLLLLCWYWLLGRLLYLLVVERLAVVNGSWEALLSLLDVGIPFPKPPLKNSLQHRQKPMLESLGRSRLCAGAFQPEEGL